MDRNSIKTARVALKLSQAALGKAVGMTGSDISRIECGYRDLGEEEAVKIAAALNLAPQSAVLSCDKPTAVEQKPQSAGAAPAATAPSGSNLDDPANFTELPDLTVLDRGTISESAHKDRLARQLARTNTILHTSKVRASVWREWRQFGFKLESALRVA